MRWSVSIPGVIYFPLCHWFALLSLPPLSLNIKQRHKILHHRCPLFFINFIDKDGYMKAKKTTSDQVVVKIRQKDLFLCENLLVWNYLKAVFFRSLQVGLFSATRKQQLAWAPCGFIKLLQRLLSVSLIRPLAIDLREQCGVQLHCAGRRGERRRWRWRHFCGANTVPFCSN